MTPADYHGCGTWLEGHIPIFSFFGHPGAAREASEALASTVLEVKNARSEFRLEIKILLNKSTPGNTKMVPEFELDAKWNIFIGDINQFQAKIPTSDFRPPVHRGRNFKSQADKGGSSDLAENRYVTSG